MVASLTEVPTPEPADIVKEPRYTVKQIIGMAVIFFTIAGGGTAYKVRGADEFQNQRLSNIEENLAAVAKLDGAVTTEVGIINNQLGNLDRRMDKLDRSIERVETLLIENLKRK